MRVTGTQRFQDYWLDQRFQQKKPDLARSRMHACGDNIYQLKNGVWHQLNSFHGNADGSPNVQHIKTDTSTNRVLFSNDFVYFGGEGPKIPAAFRRGKDLCVSGIGRKVFDDQGIIDAFVGWLNGLGAAGYCGRPMDWLAGEWK